MQVIYQKYLNKAAEVSKQLNINNPRKRQYINIQFELQDKHNN